MFLSHQQYKNPLKKNRKKSKKYIKQWYVPWNSGAPQKVINIGTTAQKEKSPYTRLAWAFKWASSFDKQAVATLAKIKDHISLNAMKT